MNLDGAIEHQSWGLELCLRLPLCLLLVSVFRCPLTLSTHQSQLAPSPDAAQNCCCAVFRGESKRVCEVLAWTQVPPSGSGWWYKAVVVSAQRLAAPGSIQWATQQG